MFIEKSARRGSDTLIACTDTLWCTMNMCERIIGISLVLIEIQLFEVAFMVMVSFGRFFLFLEDSLHIAHTKSQSHYHKITCYLSAIYHCHIRSSSLIIVECQRFRGVKWPTRSTSDPSKNMPTTVSLQPKKKKEHRLIQHCIMIVHMR